MNYSSRLKAQSKISDTDRFRRASKQNLGLTFMPTSQRTTPVTGAALKEFGRAPNQKAQSERRKRLAASLEGRTTKTSKQRALKRLMAQYGITAE